MAYLNASAPNLPVPPAGYTPEYMQQLTYALRVYFSQNDSSNFQVVNDSASGTVQHWLDAGCY